MVTSMSAVFSLLRVFLHPPIHPPTPSVQHLIRTASLVLLFLFIPTHPPTCSTEQMTFDTTVHDEGGEMTIDEKRVSPSVVEALAQANITHFTPIQRETYDPLFDGRDMIGKKTYPPPAYLPPPPPPPTFLPFYPLHAHLPTPSN